MPTSHVRVTHDTPTSDPNPTYLLTITPTAPTPGEERHTITCRNLHTTQLTTAALSAHLGAPQPLAAIELGHGITIWHHPGSAQIRNTAAELLWYTDTPHRNLNTVTAPPALYGPVAVTGITAGTGKDQAAYLLTAQRCRAIATDIAAVHSVIARATETINDVLGAAS